MKVRSVVIDSLNLELFDSDVAKLSKHVADIIAHRRSPIVLINEHGDDLLRKVPKLFDTDLVYSVKSTKPFQGLFIGIQGAGVCSFYLPLHTAYGEESVWLELEKNLIQLPYLNTTHILIHKSGGPWLITPAGMLYLKMKDDTYDLEKDPDLNKLYI